MITHRATSNLLNRRLITENSNHAGFQPAQLSVPLKETINVVDGPKKAPIRGMFDSTDNIDSKLGGSPFDLHKISPNPGANATTSLALSSLKNLHRPNLEHDVNQFGSDCHAYAWSTNSQDGNGPYSSRASNQNAERHFVRFPVERGKCDGVRCSFDSESTHGRICSGVGDHGSPILCGPQKKLTYLIAGHTHTGVSGCSDKFDAYHVPHMVKNIKDLGLSNIL